MVFYEDANSSVTHVNFSVEAPANHEKISWIHSGIFNLCLLLVILIIGIIFTLILIGSLFSVWKNKLWKLGGRVYFTGIVLAATAFIWILHYWNSLGFHF